MIFISKRQTQIVIDESIFNPTYLPHLSNYKTRHEVYYGGSGSGKSHFIAQKLVIKALSSKRKVLVTRKVGNTLRDSCWQLIIDTLQQFQLYSKCKINKTEMKIELPNGSLFLFKGLDDNERIKSITGITDIWLEECTEFTVDDYTQLNLRLRAKYPYCQMFLSFNPISKQNWVYKYLGFDTGKIPKDTMILKTTYKDNRFLPQDYIQTLENMKETNPTYYKIYVEGDFATLDKLVYQHIVEEFDYQELIAKGHTPIFGLDFGYIADESAFICAIVDDVDKKLYIFDEHYQKAMLNNEIAGMIISKGYSKEIIIADSAEPKSIQEIKNHNIPRIKKCYKGKGSILQGIQKIQQYQIIVHPKCENTIIELQNYSWKKNKQTNEYTNEPIDTYNHLMDALRYAIQTIQNKGKVKLFNKNLLGL